MLECLEEATDIPSERKIVAEKDLVLDVRDRPFSEYSRRTRLDIAVLNKTRRVSSCGDLSILSMPKILLGHQWGRT